jgi:molybdopterin converting factor small subunit
MPTHTVSAAAPRGRTAKVHILFFGKPADLLGRGLEVVIPSDGCSVRTLRRLVGERLDGALRALAQSEVRWALDREVVDDDAWVRPGAEVAAFSMFSGG